MQPQNWLFPDSWPPPTSHAPSTREFKMQEGEWPRLRPRMARPGAFLEVGREVQATLHSLRVAPSKLSQRSQRAS